MSTPYASGDNYRVLLDDAHAVVTVWRRPDLDSAAGARNANEMAAVVRKVTPQLATLVLDLRDAPVVAGPKTVETLGELLRGCETSGVVVAVALSGDPVQLLQFRRLVATYAPTKGKAVVSLTEADEHVKKVLPSRR